jgi:hypothetical protein
MTSNSLAFRFPQATLHDSESASQGAVVPAAVPPRRPPHEDMAVLG